MRCILCMHVPIAPTWQNLFSDIFWSDEFNREEALAIFEIRYYDEAYSCINPADTLTGRLVKYIFDSRLIPGSQVQKLPWRFPQILRLTSPFPLHAILMSSTCHTHVIHTFSHTLKTMTTFHFYDLIFACTSIKFLSDERSQTNIAPFDTGDAAPWRAIYISSIFICIDHLWFAP